MTHPLEMPQADIYEQRIKNRKGFENDLMAMPLFAIRQY